MSREQCRPAVDHVDGSVGADLGAVPQQAPAGLEVLTGSGCAYLVCRLPYVARRGLDLPAEAGLDDVESDGIRFVFASELRGREIPIRYDVEEGPEGTRAVARLTLPEKLGRTLAVKVMVWPSGSLEPLLLSWTASGVGP